METSTSVAAPRPVEKSSTSVARKQSGGSHDPSESGALSFVSVLTSMESEADPGPAADAVLAAPLQAAAPPLLLSADASALLAQNPNRAMKADDLGAAVLAAQCALAGVPEPTLAAPGLAGPADARRYRQAVRHQGALACVA